MLRAHTFGQCAFSTASTRIAPDSEVHFVLLLSVVAAPRSGIARDELVARIWPQAPLNDGRHCLRQAMYRLRQRGVPLQLRSGIVVLDWSEVEADVHALLYGAPTREELVHLGGIPFLPSYTPSMGRAVTRWLEELHARVATRLRRALADEVAKARTSGRFDDMGHVARALLTLDPLNEVGTMGLAEALALEGSKVQALRILEHYEEEVGDVNAHLQLPVRVLRRRVSEVLDDTTSTQRCDVPFIGRTCEFADIRALFREVCTGHSHIAFITGEAGIGKSRLATEFLRLAALDGATLATYAPSAGDVLSPISTLVSVGQQLLTLPGALGCAQEHLSYVRRLGTPDTAVAWSLAGVAADILYAQLVQAFAELISAIAEEAPLLLFFDDAERLHPTTWRVLADVWDRVGCQCAMFLFAARRLPSSVGTMGARPCDRLPRHVRLLPFSREDSLRFLVHWSERHSVALGAPDSQRFADISQGNPYYLIELAAHHGRALDPLQIPPSIRDLIASQHAALSRGTQRALLMVALLESRATISRLKHALEIPATALMAALDELEDVGLIATKGPDVWCRHRMVSDVAMSIAMPSVLAFAHVRAAELLEAEAANNNSTELLGDCVTHWERAGDTRRAYAAAMSLGDRLVGLGMGEEAKEAFRAARRFADCDKDILTAIEGSVSAGQLCADWHGVLASCREREAIQQRMGTSATSGDDFHLFAAEASMLTLGADSPAVELATLAGDASAAEGFRVKAATLAAMMADNSYDPHAINDAYSAVRSLCERSAPPVECILCSLVFHTAAGDPNRVRSLALSYAAYATNSADKRLQIHGIRRAGNALVRVGLHTDAQRLLKESLDLAEGLRLSGQAFATSDVLLTSYLLNGQLNLAEKELIRARQLAARAETEARKLMLRYSSIMFAWLTNDRRMAQTLARESTPQVRHLLASTRYCATIGEIALKLMVAPLTIVREELRSCEDLFARGSGLGRQDLNTSVLCSALAIVGDIAMARTIEREYLAHRREVNSCIASFAARAVEV